MCGALLACAGGALLDGCATPQDDISGGPGDGSLTDAQTDATGDAGDSATDSESDSPSDATADGGDDASSDAPSDAPEDAPIDTQPDANPITGLGLWYEFESTAGSEFDFSGNNNHGVVSGPLARGVPGKIGKAFDFSGGDARVQTKSAQSLDMTSGGTIEFWIKLSSVAAGVIVGRGTGNNDNSVRIKTSQGNIQVVFTRVGGISANLISNTSVLQTGQWQHVAAVNTGSQLKLYVNGALHMTASGGAMGSMFADLYVGKGAASDPSFNGTIDDLRWWSIARSDQEVCQDAGGTPTTLADGGPGCTLP